MTNINEEKYLQILRNIRDNGDDRIDRTGIGIRSLFGVHERFDLKLGFPLLTTRKINFETISSELLWFIEGSNDERRLAEIKFGKDRSELNDKTTIWTDNCNAPYWKDKKHFIGDLGRIYGVQWRKWRKPIEHSANNWSVIEIDQLTTLIHNLKENPYSRRHIITAWNPGEIDSMALPPCHFSSQFFVSSDGELSCQLYQRSSDFAIGGSINIPSYALLTHMIAQVCGYTVGELCYSIGDAHIYHNLFDAVEEQLSRVPYSPPELVINPNVKDIDSFSMNDFSISDYTHHPLIKMPMAI